MEAKNLKQGWAERLGKKFPPFKQKMLIPEIITYTGQAGVFIFLRTRIEVEYLRETP